MKEKVHHYTTIDTLALILKTKKIRFSRLDRVDDVTECKIYGQYDMSKYIFISCWTYQKEESIPQWHMYTDKMKGVRISFDKDMFNYQPIKLLNLPENKHIFKLDGESPIPFESLFTDDYIVLPVFGNKVDLERNVEYVDNPYNCYKDIVTIKTDENGISIMNISEITKLAMYKSKDWEFQREIRFALIILPGLPIPACGIMGSNYLSQMPPFIIKSIVYGIAPKIEYFDVELNQDVLDNIEVILGPLNNESNRIIVEALLSKYTKNGSLANSNLKGKIRTPKR